MRKLPLALAAALLLATTACKGSAQAQFDPCTIQPTRVSTPADEGYPDVWVEGDGEKIDSDPCDSDDFERDKFGHLIPVRKPEFNKQPIPTKTPVKVTTTKPAPKSTKR